METENLTMFVVNKDEKITREMAVDLAETEKEIRGFVHASLVKEDSEKYVFEFRNRVNVDLEDEN